MRYHFQGLLLIWLHKLQLFIMCMANWKKYEHPLKVKINIFLMCASLHKIFHLSNKSLIIHWISFLLRKRHGMFEFAKIYRVDVKFLFSSFSIQSFP